MTGDPTTPDTSHDLLGRVLAPDPPPFALLHRPEATGPGALEVLVGAVSRHDLLAELPVPELPEPPEREGPLTAAGTSRPRHELLALIPYRQVAERGFACHDDGTPLLALAVTDQQTVALAEALARIPDTAIALRGGDFDIGDDAYADMVRRVIDEQIGRGEGANFVLKRSWTTDIVDHTPHKALAFFRRLVERESGAYWTFIVHTGDRTLVGASPERHISLRRGLAVMNPISGTYRYPPSGPVLPEVMSFLDDRKEADELYMVVDEELKMMARICEPGVRVVGPYLKEMSRLAHTEYVIEGHSTRDVREVLRQTMFAPTVTGSPLENACRVIGHYEPHGRGFYSGVVALVGRDEHGERSLDSAILIRTADIDASGRTQIGVGATLVRHSDPRSEVAETRAKAAGLLAALGAGETRGLGGHPRVRAALERRNATIADFWLGSGAAGEAGTAGANVADAANGTAAPAGTARPELAGRTALIVDAEDTFTSMLDHQLRAIGLAVTVRRYDEPHAFADHDLVVLGPGPGDPRDTAHPKIDYLWQATRVLLEERRPFLAVCLSHQVLSRRLGLDLVRRTTPNQGVQKEISLFGVPERVGFYNTFAAHCGQDLIQVEGVGAVEVCRDQETGEVHALRGPSFSTMQFHAESVLTQNGPGILGTAITGALGVPV